jgi:predicted ArsR family transcriptional regulator
MSGDERTEADLREVTDARSLRALTHPVRLQLIELLSVVGPMTATQAGERIGESATTCSFHLRQLAKYGFVTEAGGGRGRARPWRMTSIGLRLTSSGKDPEFEVAARAFERLVRARQLERYQHWLETRESYTPEWREAAGDSDLVFYLTAEELKALNEELLALLVPRALDRLEHPERRPPNAAPVELQLFTFPVAPPEA